MTLSTNHFGNESLAEAMDAWVATNSMGGQLNHMAAVVIDEDFPAGKRVQWAGIGADRSTRFQIGSCAKPMLGHVYSDMVADGVVSPTDTVGTYIAGLQGGLEDVQLKHFVTHQSGLARETTQTQSKLSAWASDPTQPDPYDVDLEGLVQGCNEVFTAGNVGGVPLYSNCATALLGNALAIADDTTYPELMRDRLFRKVMAVDTRIPQTLENAEPDFRYPLGYSTSGTASSKWFLNASAPAGGVWASIADIGRFLRSVLLRKAPGMDATIGQTLVDPESPDYSYGYFWQVSNPSGNILLHNGLGSGMRSWMGVIYSHRRAVALFSDTLADVGLLWDTLILDNLEFEPV